MNRVNQLWSRRFVGYWREASLYGSYAARSGFFTFLFLIFIVGSYYYVRSLETIPDTFPYLWVIVPLMLIVLVKSPIRTFLKEADAVFLLPAEAQMAPYFRRSFRYSLVMQGITVILIFLAIWPLYVHFHPSRSDELTWFLLFLLLIKWSNLLGSWQEGRLVYPRHRLMLQLLRWPLTGSALYPLFQMSFLQTAVWLLVLFFITMLLYRFPAKYKLHWTYLIQTEQRRLAMQYLFFSWFTDVPKLPAKVRQRKWIVHLTTFVPFSQQQTFLYLYIKTFIRSELFDIIVRLAVIGGLLIATIQTDAAKVVIWGIILFVVGIQASSIEKQHRYTFWLQLYPVNVSTRITALSKIIFICLLVVNLWIGTVFAITAVSPKIALICILLGVGFAHFYSYRLYPGNLRKRLFQP